MYIENLSNQEITEKIKDFCNRAITTVHNDKRTSQDTYNMILEVDKSRQEYTGKTTAKR